MANGAKEAAATAGQPEPPARIVVNRADPPGAGAQRILFVCLGNICRSPTAEVVLRTRAARAGFGRQIVTASAGIGNWHVGMPPDRRAITYAQKRGYDLSGVRARQVARADFDRFDWVLGMDQSNLRELRLLDPPAGGARLGLFLDFAPQLGLRDVPDPYYGGGMHFERVLDLVEQASDGLLARLCGRRIT
jgi:protein-tyrosine phosphatase